MLSQISKNLPQFQQSLSGAVLDVPAFLTKLAHCTYEPASCYCCAMGAYVTAGEAEQVRTQIHQKPNFFDYINVNKAPLTQWENRTQEHFVQKPCSYTLPNLKPEHHTACSMRDDAGRCSLQSLAMSEGKHPWWYKPLECWLFPIVIVPGTPPRITLASHVPGLYGEEENPDFLQHARCAQTDEKSGAPAYQKLAQELEMLGKLLKRDLLAEIRRETAEMPQILA